MKEGVKRVCVVGVGVAVFLEDSSAVSLKMLNAYTLVKALPFSVAEILMCAQRSIYKHC